MRCPKCQAPVKVFLVASDDDVESVLVNHYPRMGTLRRTSVVTNEAIETDPHPGGWVRHECEVTA